MDSFEVMWEGAGAALAPLPQSARRRLQIIRLRTDLAKLESDERRDSTIAGIKALARARQRQVVELDDYDDRDLANRPFTPSSWMD